MDLQEDKILGGNLHYLNPDYRDGGAKGLINKTSAILPKKTLHRYFYSNIGDIFIIPPDPEEYASVAQLVLRIFLINMGRRYHRKRLGIQFKCLKQILLIIILTMK